MVNWIYNPKYSFAGYGLGLYGIDGYLPIPNGLKLPVPQFQWASGPAFEVDTDLTAVCLSRKMSTVPDSDYLGTWQRAIDELDKWREPSERLFLFNLQCWSWQSPDGTQNPFLVARFAKVRWCPTEGCDRPLNHKGMHMEAGFIYAPFIPDFMKTSPRPRWAMLGNCSACDGTGLYPTREGESLRECDVCHGSGDY